MITPGYEYFDEGNEALRDPNTYLGKSPLDMVRQFHRIMDQELDQPYVQNSELDRLRLTLVSEEFDEVCAAETPDNLLKELADLVYVAYGYAAAFGWDLDEAVRRVHASNMSKLDDEGQPIKQANGKVLKGPNYAPPTLTDLMRGSYQ
jgi:predicted HAD superfamily Cof-like phosphohydrolase